MHTHKSVRPGQTSNGIVAVPVQRLDSDSVEAFAGGAHRDSHMIDCHVNRDRLVVRCDLLLSDGPESVEEYDAVRVVVVQENPQLPGMVNTAKVNLDPRRREG